MPLFFNLKIPFTRLFFLNTSLDFFHKSIWKRAPIKHIKQNLFGALKSLKSTCLSLEFGYFQRNFYISHRTWSQHAAFFLILASLEKQMTFNLFFTSLFIGRCCCPVPERNPLPLQHLWHFSRARCRFLFRGGPASLQSWNLNLTETHKSRI